MTHTMLTKEALEQLKENDLRTKIVIPLLRAMGFRGVFDFHGGSGEQGKDVVCWKPDELGNRVNYAVVLKAGPITGKAQIGRGTAGEVTMQIQQCFGSTFPDPQTGEPQAVHQCWVITNGRISKEAHNAIGSALGSYLERITRFVDGDELWRLVKKHLIKNAVYQNLSEAGRVLSSIDPHYSVVAVISGDKTRFTVSEKYPGAGDEKPLHLKFEFAFPKTPAGKAMLDAFENHIATGAPITIPAEYIRSVNFPDLFNNLFEDDLNKILKIEIGGAVNPEPILLRLEFSNHSGERFVLPHVEFTLLHDDTKESTYNAEHPTLPLIFKMVRLPEEKKLTFHLSSKEFPQEQNVATALKYQKFCQCVSEAFSMLVIHEESQIVLSELRHENGIVDRPDPQYLQMLEDLAEIQSRVKRLINIPVRGFTRDEVHIIALLRTALHGGKIPLRGIIPYSVKASGIPSILDKFGDQKPKWLRTVGEEKIELFGTEIPMGKVRLDAFVKLLNEEEIRKEYEAAFKDNRPINVSFEIVDEENSYKLFQDWLPRVTDGGENS